MSQAIYNVRLMGLLAGTLLLAAPYYACAQATNDATPNSASVPVSGLWSQIAGDKTDVSIGLGAGIDQRYMGARDFRPLLVPLISVSRGIFFLDTMRGAGVQYQSASGFYIGEGLNYDSGRDNRNDWLRAGSNDLRNMPSVKGTITSTTTLSQTFFPWLSVNAQAELGLDGHQRGNQYQLGVESIAYKRNKETLTFDLDAKIADRQYNQTYFGTNGGAGSRAYSPGFGLYAWSLSATWDHKFDRHWSTELVVSTSFYTDKVADSPVVQRRFGLTVLPSVSYAF